jgi:DNA-binding NtrC family response regulator
MATRWGAARPQEKGLGLSAGEGTRADRSSGTKVVARVLVIDDEQLLGQTIQLGLEDDMDVELETSGELGLKRLLTDDTINLVLCDLSLPDLSGIEIYHEVAEQRPELLGRFVIMTGGAVTRASRDFLENYRGPLLNKPFTITQVEGLVQSLLAPR